jgi:hypothetical protein
MSASITFLNIRFKPPPTASQILTVLSVATSTVRLNNVIRSSDVTYTHCYSSELSAHDTMLVFIDSEGLLLLLVQCRYV